MNEVTGSEPLRNFISTAVVKVYQDSNLIEMLEGETFEADYQDVTIIAPRYTTVDFTPQTGIPYTIVVQVPNFEEVRATSMIPINIPLDSISFQNTIDDVGGGINQVDFEVNIEFDDPVQEDNYYHIIFIQEKTEFNLTPDGQIEPIYTDLVLPGNFQVNPKYSNNSIIKFSDQRSFLIADNLLNGQKFTIPFEGYITYDANSHVLEPFKVEFRTVTEDYYKYLKGIAQNLQFGSDPNSGPGSIHNNIRGGYGNFSGYNSVITTFDIGN